MKNTLIKNTILSIICVNCLHAADINTTVELRAHIEKFGISDFVKFRHFGSKTFNELKKFVEENKLIENEVSEDAKKLAIEYAEWLLKNKCKPFGLLYWEHTQLFTTRGLFYKFIEQRNK